MLGSGRADLVEAALRASGGVGVGSVGSTLVVISGDGSASSWLALGFSLMGSSSLAHSCGVPSVGVSTRFESLGKCGFSLGRSSGSCSSVLSASWGGTGLCFRCRPKNARWSRYRGAQWFLALLLFCSASYVSNSSEDWI